MLPRLLLFLTLLNFFASKWANSQNKTDTNFSTNSDTLKIKNTRPRNAAILSAVLPGAGQVYNKKYWKVPLIYTGFGGLGYLVQKNHKEFSWYRNVYRSLIDTIPGNEIETPYNAEQLRLLKEGARRNRDFFIILAGVWYAANIVDAIVDAHLYDFDVSDNLSLKVGPFVNWSVHRAFAQPAISGGVTLKLQSRHLRKSGY